MSREATSALAKSAWIILLLYVIGNRFVGLVIGRVLADMLVPVVALAAIVVAIYCLTRIRVHGRRGILAHAIAALVIAPLLLAIWTSNMISARSRAQAAETRTAAP